MIKFIRKLYAKWLYRKAPYGICCCGSDMDNHGIDFTHSPTDSKERAIEQFSKGTR